MNSWFSPNSGPQVILKTVEEDESETGTTVVDSSYLAASVVSGGIYRFELFARITNAGQGGGKIRVTTPANTTCRLYDYNLFGFISEANTPVSGDKSLFAGSGSGLNLYQGFLIAGGDGTVQVKFAAADADDATNPAVLVKGSYLTLTRLA